MATTLTTENLFNGNGSNRDFVITFPYLKETDVKVEHPIGTVLSSGYTFLNSTTIRITTAPASGTANVKIYRDTNVDAAEAVFATGSSIRATDLNNNEEKSLFSDQEKVYTSDISSQAVTSTEIKDGTIVNIDISPTAEIEVSKLKDGASRQVLQTDAAGTGVEWTSNVDIPGTLDVAGATDLDGSLNVDGTTTAAAINASGAVGIDGDFDVNTNKFTVAAATGNTVIAGNLDVTGQFDVTGTSNYTGQQTVPGGALVKNIRVGLDGDNEVSTSSGNLVLDSAGGTVQVTDAFNVTGNADVDSNLNVDGTLTVDGVSTLTGNVSVGGTVDGRDINADGTKLDGIDSGAKDDQTSTEIKSLLASDNLTDAHLAANSVGTSEIKDDAVDTDQLNNLAVTNAKLENTSVTENKIANEAVTTGKIADDAVTYAKMQDVSATNVVLGRDSAGAGIVEQINTTNLRTMINVEDGATADQTDAEIKTAYENNSNTNAYTDAEKSKLTGIEASAKDDQTAAEIKTAYESNADTNPLTDAEKAVIDGVTANTSELNILDDCTTSTAELNLLTGKSIVTTIAANATDSQLASAQAVNERIVELVTEVGGFVPIANEVSFPNTNPDVNDGAGTIVSIADAGGVVVNGSGVSTTGRTLGGSTVTINGIDSSLNSTTIAAGQGMLVETTTTLNTYTYHRLVIDEAGVQNAKTAVDDFNERYRVGSSNPSSNNDDGDLFFNTTSDKMLVYNATGSSWDEVQSVGNFFINTISSYSGTGGNSATFNGSAYRFVLSNAGSDAQQHIVSVNGVIQKPNSGTSQPSEGFAIDGSSIIFSAAPASGSDYFIITVGASVNIGSPSNNTVTSAMIVDGTITGGDIATDTISEDKLDIHAAPSGTNKFLGYTSNGMEWAVPPDTNTTVGGATGVDFNDTVKARFGTGNDLEIYHSGTASYIVDNGTGDLILRASDQLKIQDTDNGENMAIFNKDGAVELYHNNVKKFETASDGVLVSGNAQVTGEFGLFSGSTDAARYIDCGLGDNNALTIRGCAGGDTNHQTLAAFTRNGSADLYYDNSKKLATGSGGVDVTGGLNVSGNLHCTADGGKLISGAGDDLQIYHDGTNSILDNNTGDIIIRCDSDDIKILAEDDIVLRDNDDSTNFIHCVNGGSVDLYYNGSKKFETKTAGVGVTGSINVSGNLELEDSTASNVGRIRMGNSDDFHIYHDGSNSYIHDGGTGQLRVSSSNFKVLNAAQSETIINAVENGAVSLYYDNAKKFETRSDGILVSGNIQLNDSNRLDVGNNGDLRIYHDGSNSHITNATGHVELNSSWRWADNAQVRCGAASDLKIYHDGSHSRITNTTGWLYINNNSIKFRDSDEGDVHAVFNHDGACELYYDGSKRLETFSHGIIVQAPEGSAGYFHLYADEGDNNADKWRFYAATDGKLEIQNYASGSWEKNQSMLGDSHVSLYYDAAKKFETTSTGWKSGDGVKGVFGGGDDLQIIHDGANSYIQHVAGGAGNLYIQAADDATIYIKSGNGSSGTENAVVCNDNSSVDLYHSGNKKFETTANGAAVTGHISGAHGVLEQFFSPCDGSVIALVNGNFTMPSNVTDYQDLTTSWVELTGSSVSYTPPTGTKQVIYEFHFMCAHKDANAIVSTRLYLDSDEVYHARTCWRGDVFSTRSVMRWGFNIGGSADTDVGRVASWTSAKTIKMDIIEYASGNEGYAHRLVNYGTSTTDIYPIKPCLGITAIG